MATRSTYYYAGGEKVPLRPVTEIVAFGPPATSHELPNELREHLEKTCEPVMEGISVVPVEQLGDQLLPMINEELTTYPVYAGEANGMLVALPEVRIEYADAESADKLEAWLVKNADRVTVVRRNDQQLVLRPRSGKGEDALKVANDIHRKIHPLMSQPRFLRIVERPDLRPPGQQPTR